MKTYAFATLIASIFLLSGCTGEPSEQDIYTAMNKVVEQTNAIVKSIAGKDVPKDALGNDSNLLIVFYVQIMPDDFVMQLHRF